MPITKQDAPWLLENRLMTPEVATVMTEKLINGLMNKNQTEEIEDDRYAHVISRSQSRFSAPVGTNQILSIELHPSGNSLAYSRIDGSLTVWLISGSTFARSKKIYITNAAGPERVIHSLSWNSDEINQLATVSSSSKLFIWTVDERKRSANKIRTISVGPKLKILKCVYDPTGSWLLTLAKSGELHLFDVKKDHEMHSQFDVNDAIPGESVQSIAWNNSGSHLFLGLKSGKLALLELNHVEGFKLCLVLQAHKGPISSICVEPWGRFVITGSTDGLCAVWDISTMCCSILIDDLDSAVTSLVVDNLGKILALCTENGKLQFRDINSGKIFLDQRLKNPNTEGIIRFYPDKTWFIWSGKDDILQRHFTPSSCTDPLSLWKLEYENSVSNIRNKNSSRKTLKRDREHDTIRERSRTTKREQSRTSRFSDRH